MPLVVVCSVLAVPLRDCLTAPARLAKARRRGYAPEPQTLKPLMPTEYPKPYNIGAFIVTYTILGVLILIYIV